jgi:shikimate kinase/3-dehydroquinate synthase
MAVAPSDGSTRSASLAPRGGPALVLIGFMAAGKTTAGQILAGSSGAQAIDSDELLVERLGYPIARAFTRDGEAAFRAAEEELVLELLDRADASTVISLGGGSVLAPRVQAALNRHLVVHLDVDVDTAWSRVHAPDAPVTVDARPLAADRPAFERRYAERLPLYRRLARATLPTGDEAMLLRALPHLRGLAEGSPGRRLLWARASSGEYPVIVGEGALTGMPWPLRDPASRRIVVSDEVVGPLYGRSVEPHGEVIAIPAGERHKTLAVAECVWRTLAERGVTRADHVVALGGGVVGDLAGFCASSYQRGIPVVQVPTTLVAQVDSAFGGKTGVDLPEGKNYVGAFHQPAAVIVDPATLATLPAVERAAGYAEVVKTALIAGGELWERVRGGAPVDGELILECARTKLAIVAEDERDGGRRQVLNLGHTVGHAIETVTGYTRYRHGEAVALGLLAALRLSGAPSLREEVSGLLANAGLPTRLADGIDAEAVVAATARDKKRVGAHVPFVLLETPGAPRTGAIVDGASLLAAVRELCGP